MNPYANGEYPGENLVHYSQAIAKIFRDLAPEIADQTQVYAMIKAFIYPLPDQKAPSFSQLKNLLKKSLHPENQQNIPILLDVLKGAVHFKNCFKLEDFAAFDQMLYIRKELTLEGGFTEGREIQKNKATKLHEVQKNLTYSLLTK